MGRPLGEKISEKTTITFTPSNLRNMQKSIDNKGFKTVTELVNHCIQFFYTRQEVLNPELEIREYLNSDVGQKVMEEEIQKAWNSNPLTRELRALLEERRESK